ncbi:MAG: DEAD/DEAH box helicase [Candidatus Caldatribacteriota bacterium]|nr:DEAD/DEAH box helicase [Candidatus Caldatribacteriota bacterium]
MKDKIKFEHLGLSQRVLDAVYKKGFEEPSSIQALTIPVMLRDDTDIIAQAQTGTGKTAAFGLPLIEMINPGKRSVQALIITPTRELAIQVSEEIRSLKGDSGILVIPIYGGQSIDQQLRRLKKGVHIVVGTPGRIIDHLKRKTLNLKDIEHLILDEADEMLNMGFIEDMEEIMKYTNPEKRTLLFSATMPPKIKALASKYMADYKFITVKKQTITVSLTEQIYYEVKASDKFEALCRIIDIEEDFYGLVFCRTKNDVDSVVSHLIDRGYDADAIHGDISQAQREKTLGKFKKKQINVLIATDVAARGIDIVNMTHVINYSLPHDPEAYVHRIGRTGRAGKGGTAITFITPSEYNKLMFIKRKAKTDIKKSKVPNVRDIIKSKKKKIDEDITAINSEEVGNTYYNWAKKLLTNTNPTEALAKLLSYSFDDKLNPGLYNEIKDLSARNRKIEMEGRTRLFVALGKRDNKSPSKLVKFIIQNTGVKNSAIDQVEVYNNFSFITVPFKEAEIILGVFQKKSGKRKKSLVVKARKKAK